MGDNTRYDYPCIETAVRERKGGHYIHALEVNNVEEIKSAIETLVEELLPDYPRRSVLYFIASIDVYCLDESNEKSVQNYDLRKYANSCIRMSAASCATKGV